MTGGQLLAVALRDGALPPEALERAAGRVRPSCLGELSLRLGPGTALAGTALAVGPAAAPGPAGEVALSLDGRVDNREELAARLGLTGAGLSDAQLLLAAWERDGESFLDAAQGPFAVTLVDPRRNLALAARDGLGNGYLSWVLTPQLFAASSEDVALLELPGVAADLDRVRLAEYFAAEPVAGAETYFRDVRAVLPGEMLIVEGRTLRRRQLPRPGLEQRLELPRFEDYVERFAELLRSSVERCLRGHRRVAVLMSGGLDSTPVAAWAARLLGGGGPAVTALSWGLSDPDGDERPWVEAMSRRAGLDLQWVPCDDAVPFADLARWPVHPSTPGQSSFRWFHQRSYARARELGHRLVLSGFCGDPLYSGARGWLWSLLAAAGPGAAIDQARAMATERGWLRVLRSALVGPLVRRLVPARRRWPAHLSRQAVALLESRPGWPPDLAAARRPEQARLLLDPSSGHGLRVERDFAAPFGLEPAWPLRDARLVSFALAVPDHLLENGVETRPVLRAATRGLLPEEVRLRRGKASFMEVFRRGFERSRLPWAPALLLHEDALWRGLVEEERLRAWLAAVPEDGGEELCFSLCVKAELWRHLRSGGELGSLAGCDEAVRPGCGRSGSLVGQA